MADDLLPIGARVRVTGAWPTWAGMVGTVVHHGPRSDHSVYLRFDRDRNADAVLTSWTNGDGNEVLFDAAALRESLEVL